MNKTIAMIKTQIRSISMSVGIFYGCYLGALLAVYVLIRLLTGETQSMGAQFSGQIFMFVFGLVFTRQAFYFGTSNCVSRKSIFNATVILGVGTSLIMSLIDIAVNNIFKIGTLADFFPTLNTNFLTGFMLMFVSYVLILFFGMFLSFIYYRLEKMGKWIFSLGVGALMIIIPTTLTMLFTSGNTIAIDIVKAVINFFEWMGKNTVNYSIVLVAMTLVFAVGSFLLIRKASVKDSRIM